MASAEQPDPNRRPPTTLNDLPESLLIHILTLLPILSAIGTSFISRQWRNLWHLMPTLKFNEDDEPLFPDEAEYDVRLVNTITQVLFNRPKSNPLRLFYLNFIYSPNHRHRSFVTSWIRYALDCNVEDMSLCFYCDEEEAKYQFQFSNIKNTHVRCLKLWRCEIVMPRVDSIQFDSLRVLYLTMVWVDDDSLADLISRSKNLEKLRLSDFEGLRNFKIRSKSLRTLHLSYSYYTDANDESSIEIHTPNLSKIKVNYFYVVNYAGDLSSVKRVLVRFWNGHKNLQKCWGNAKRLNLLCGVESLKIKEMLPRYVLSKFESDGCFQLERLKHLEVQVGCTFNDMLHVFVLLERAPALQTLVFSDVAQSNNEERFFDELNGLEFKLQIPCLREVKMLGFRNTMFEYGILLLLWKHGVVLNKVVLESPVILGKPIVILDPRSNDFVKFLFKRRID